MRRTLVALASVSLTALSTTAVAPSSLANGLAPPGCGESFSGGAGTTTDPYLISSAADFTALNGDSDCWSGDFLQTGNIDMGGVTWDIANTSQTTTGTALVPFSGTYDGGNLQVSGLTIDVGTAASDDNGGLFGVVTGTIRNLGFIDTDLTTETVIADDVVGGLVGSLHGGTVSNSFTTAYVYGDSDYVGGLVGEMTSGAVINNSHATGAAEGDGDYVGGLVGGADDGAIIDDSYSTGTVEGDGDYTGGLIGALDDSTSLVRGSHSTANVTSTDTYAEETGGLIGYLNRARVVNSYATGTVTGVQYVGGLVGSANRTASISGAYATGNVGSNGTAGKDVGGLIGVVEADASVTNCYATGSVSGGDAGGLISDNRGTVRNCYSIGEVEGDREGGLVLDNTGTVSNSFWDTVTSSQTSSAGGTGKTTSEMKTLTTFTDAGWSITESCSSTAIWGLCTTRNSGYPYLTFYTAPPTPSDTFVPFSFLLPDGRECTSISPISVAVGSQFRLPSADALCGTMTGSQIIGWTIPSPIDYTGAGSTSMPFAPGQLVRVVEGQRFTAVLWEPILQLDFDANIATRDTCLQTKALHTSDDGRLEHVWVPRADISMARFPASSSCVPEGYVLIGWNTAGDGSGETYEPGAAMPEDWAEETANSHRLFAVWAPSL